MTEKSCNLCDYTTSDRSNFVRHMKRHETKEKQRLVDQKEKEDKFKANEEKIKSLERENQKLKEHKFNAYTDTNVDYITRDTFINKISSSGADSRLALMAMIHFNSHYPENFNIYMVNKEKVEITRWNGKKWCPLETYLDEFLKDIEKKYQNLVTKYDCQKVRKDNTSYFGFYNDKKRESLKKGVRNVLSNQDNVDKVLNAHEHGNYNKNELHEMIEKCYDDADDHFAIDEIYNYEDGDNDDDDDDTETEKVKVMKM